MALLSVADFEEHFETDLATAAIQRLLDDAEDEIDLLFGDVSSQVEEIVGGDEFLFLSRPASTVSEVVETVGDEDTTLASNDYIKRHGGRMLERDPDGTNGRTRWGSRVKVTYTPVDETNRRKRVQADLVKLAIQFEGLSSSRVGNISDTMGDYEGRRQAILSRLADPLGMV